MVSKFLCQNLGTQRLVWSILCPFSTSFGSAKIVSWTTKLLNTCLSYLGQNLERGVPVASEMMSVLFFLKHCSDITWACQKLNLWLITRVVLNLKNLHQLNAASQKSLMWRMKMIWRKSILKNYIVSYISSRVLRMRMWRMLSLNIACAFRVRRQRTL